MQNEAICGLTLGAGAVPWLRHMCGLPRGHFPPCMCEVCYTTFPVIERALRAIEIDRRDPATRLHDELRRLLPRSSELGSEGE